VTTPSGLADAAATPGTPAGDTAPSETK
jgi:hypothetical protein